MTQNIDEIIHLAREYEQHPPVLRLPAGHPGDQSLASRIDHTLLKPETTPDQIDALCIQALEHEFASVCINPIFTPQAAKKLSGSRVKVCTVVGFPLGATLARIKAVETEIVIEEGAQEVDMVITVGMLKGARYPVVFEDISRVVETAHASGALVKVILETCLLNRFEIIAGSLLSQRAGADFVKTSTGFNTGGATLEDVELARRVVGPEMGVKAAGGVRTLADARAMLLAGATRLGTSAGLKIMQELAEERGA